jgi:hypothetical protein
MERFHALRSLAEPYLPHLLALGLALTAGIAIGMVKANSTPTIGPTADRWTLPNWAPFQSGEQRVKLASASLWGSEPQNRREVAVEAPAAPAWRFVGTVREGGDLLAVVELDKGRKVQRLKAGDQLPNGDRIQRVDDGALAVLTGSNEEVLRIFSQDKPSIPPVEAKR